MASLFSNLLSSLGFASANTGSQACIYILWDEDECPASLIK